MQIGLYRAQHDLEFGHSVWSTPSGNRVMVTTVTPVEDVERYRWPDTIVRGEVVACVKTNRRAKEHQQREARRAW